jgi:uncharacterized protein DUF7019
MRFKNASEFKYYIYISIAKLDMLYNQVASAAKEKKSIEWTIDLKALKFSRKNESEDEPDREDKLKAVIDALEYSQLVATVDEPKDYVKGTLPMRYGVYRDSGRPDEEAPLVYFGGATEETVFGFGGSTRHIEGNAGCSATGSRSATPYLIPHLLRGLGQPYSGWNAFPHAAMTEDQMVCEAITLATDNNPGPTQNLEFFAKTLFRSNRYDKLRGKTMRVLLGTPLYVALASPYPNDISNF